MPDVATLMTTEEMLALPDDGIERWLVKGELRERTMPRRNRIHSRVMTRVSQYLANWLDAQPVPRGEVLTGDAGVRIQRDPDSTYGVDVLYVTRQVLSAQLGNSTIIDGLPTLVVEILSPSDTVELINDKIDAFLAVGVPLIWIVDPYRKMVTVHQPGTEPESFNSRQDLSAEPHLPGFRVAVAKLFE